MTDTITNWRYAFSVTFKTGKIDRVAVDNTISKPLLVTGIVLVRGCSLGRGSCALHRQLRNVTVDNVIVIADFQLNCDRKTVIM